VDAGGTFESDEFAPNIPQLGRKFRGRRFNSYYHESRDPFAKNPGVNSAISDPPPDMRLRPPMRGEVDKRPNIRSPQYDGSRIGSWDNSTGKSRNLSRGDYLKGRNPNY
jgi:hypothetical protein